MQALTTKVKVQAGTYYVGDLCYVIKSDDMWSKVCDAMYPDGGNHSVEGLIVVDGYEMVTYSTMYGDGTYYDAFSNEYPVDAGLIGLISVDAIEKINGGTVDMTLGNVVTFEEDFVCDSEDGVLTFGNIIIHTEGSDVDDDEDYIDYDDDEDYAD